MLSHAESIEYLTTTTEKEALLLEASCIKKHRPHYNIVLRDDKQYVLFRINPKHPFPRLEIVRQARRDGARYFGPFTSALAARETWKLIHRAFALRRCTDRAMSTAYSGSTAIKATTATATAWGMSIWATSHAQVSKNDAPSMAMGREVLAWVDPSSREKSFFDTVFGSKAF